MHSILKCHKKFLMHCLQCIVDFEVFWDLSSYDWSKFWTYCNFVFIVFICVYHSELDMIGAVHVVDYVHSSCIT